MYLFLREYTSLTSRKGGEEATGGEGVVKVRDDGGGEGTQWRVSKVRNDGCQRYAITGCRIDFAKSNKCCTFVPAKPKKEVWVSGWNQQFAKLSYG